MRLRPAKPLVGLQKTARVGRFVDFSSVCMILWLFFAPCHKLSGPVVRRGVPQEPESPPRAITAVSLFLTFPAPCNTVCQVTHAAITGFPTPGFVGSLSSTLYSLLPLPRGTLIVAVLRVGARCVVGGGGLSRLSEGRRRGNDASSTRRHTCNRSCAPSPGILLFIPQIIKVNLHQQL